jgi:hypothetical protein
VGVLVGGMVGATGGLVAMGVGVGEGNSVGSGVIASVAVSPPGIPVVGDAVSVAEASSTSRVPPQVHARASRMAAGRMRKRADLTSREEVELVTLLTLHAPGAVVA